MKISTILQPHYIRHHLEASSKDEVIRKMLETIRDHPNIEDIEKVSTSVFEREKIMSTGVGKGIAIPHGKSEGVADIVAALAVLKTPIDFQSLDGEPVRLVVLLAARDSMVNLHIKLLSRISRLLNKDEFREKLLNSTSAEDLSRLIQEEEEQYPEI
ncbi:MAG: PTS sugar transporter subunit IIA [Bacteroidetes bacterium]|nr:PTS sugar transporter subunit IIA [Bacteroidota bacterium]